MSNPVNPKNNKGNSPTNNVNNNSTSARTSPVAPVPFPDTTPTSGAIVFASSYNISSDLPLIVGVAREPEVPAVTTAANGIQGLNISTQVAQASTRVAKRTASSAPQTAAPAPAPILRGLPTPANYVPRNYDAVLVTAPVVPNGAVADANILQQVSPVLVVRRLPKGVDANEAHRHLVQSNIPFKSLIFFDEAGKIHIAFNAFTEHTLASIHTFPWGEKYQRSIDAPYEDYDVSLRIPIDLGREDIEDPTQLIAGGFAGLNAVVEGGKWSNTKRNVYNVYLETPTCARNVLRYRGPCIFYDSLGSEVIGVLNRENVSLSKASFVKLYVGSIPAHLTVAEVEDSIMGVLERGNIHTDNFLFFSRVVSNTPTHKGKPSNFGFAQVDGRAAADHLVSPNVQHLYNGFKVTRVRPKKAITMKA